MEVTLKQNEDEHRVKERELKTDNRYLKTEVTFQILHLIVSLKNKNSPIWILLLPSRLIGTRK